MPDIIYQKQPWGDALSGLAAFGGGIANAAIQNRDKEQDAAIWQEMGQLDQSMSPEAYQRATLGILQKHNRAPGDQTKMLWTMQQSAFERGEKKRQAEGVLKTLGEAFKPKSVDYYQADGASGAAYDPFGSNATEDQIVPSSDAYGKYLTSPESVTRNEFASPFHEMLWKTTQTPDGQAGLSAFETMLKSQKINSELEDAVFNRKKRAAEAAELEDKTKERNLRNKSMIDLGRQGFATAHPAPEQYSKDSLNEIVEYRDENGNLYGTSVDAKPNPEYAKWLEERETFANAAPYLDKSTLSKSILGIVPPAQRSTMEKDAEAVANMSGYPMGSAEWTSAKNSALANFYQKKLFSGAGPLANLLRLTGQDTSQNLQSVFDAMVTTPSIYTGFNGDPGMAFYNRFNKNLTTTPLDSSAGQGGASGDKTIGKGQPVAKNIRAKAQEDTRKRAEEKYVYASIVDDWEPEMNEFMGRTVQYLSGKAEQLGGTPEGDLYARTAGVKNSLEAMFNNYRRDVTGAAAAVKELEQLRSTYPNLEMPATVMVKAVGARAFHDYFTEEYDKYMASGYAPSREQEAEIAANAKAHRQNVEAHMNAKIQMSRMRKG